jgi:hypothetical protein
MGLRQIRHDCPGPPDTGARGASALISNRLVGHEVPPGQLSMCRDPLHRLTAGTAGRGTSPARQKSAAHLRIQRTLRPGGTRQSAGNSAAGGTRLSPIGLPRRSCRWSRCAPGEPDGWGCPVQAGQQLRLRVGFDRVMDRHPGQGGGQLPEALPGPGQGELRYSVAVRRRAQRRECGASPSLCGIMRSAGVAREQRRDP